MFLSVFWRQYIIYLTNPARSNCRRKTKQHGRFFKWFTLCLASTSWRTKPGGFQVKFFDCTVWDIHQEIKRSICPTLESNQMYPDVLYFVARARDIQKSVWFAFQAEGEVWSTPPWFFQKVQSQFARIRWYKKVRFSWVCQFATFQVEVGRQFFSVSTRRKCAETVFSEVKSLLPSSTSAWGPIRSPGTYRVWMAWAAELRHQGSCRSCPNYHYWPAFQCKTHAK